MTDRRTWLPVVAVVCVVAVVVLLVVLGRSDLEVERLTVPVPEGDTSVMLDAALYRTGGASDGEPHPAVLLAHGFLGDRSSVDDRARALASQGYAVLTWSARGFGASGGQVGLADPTAEIADVSRLVDLLADRSEVRQDGPGDPRVAIVGGSYGAGTALLAAGQEPRLDAVVAAAGWHDLARSLAPNGAVGPEPVAGGVLKASWTSLLFTANALPPELLAASEQGAGAGAPDGAPGAGEDPEFDVAEASRRALQRAADPCGRFTPEICALYLDVASGGVLTDEAAAVLDARSPAGRLGEVRAPTLLLQGQDDTLFDLTESRRNAQEIAARGTPVRLRWVPGGHEIVGGGGTEALDAEVADWLERWLVGDPATGRDEIDGDLVPFTWTDVAADAPRDRDALPADDPSDLLRFALGADGTLIARSDGDAATDGQRESRGVPISSPPGGQPAAFSALPGGTALAGFLPVTDIPGQFVAVTSAPMTADTTLLGAPTLRFPLEDAAVLEDAEARLFVKITDVAPNGSTTLVQQGATPVRVTGLPVEVEVVLPDLAYRLREGHQFRLTIATTDQAFANRRDAATTLVGLGAGAELRLPVVDSVADAPGPPWVALAIVAALLVGGLVLARRSRRAPTSDAVVATASALPADPVRTTVAEPPPVVIRGLTKRYADGHLAVDGLDLTVGHGQVVGLLGPNGAGKTTSLRMLLGLSTPTAGTIELFGHRVRPGHPVLGRVGALVEGPGFVPELAGLDNLKLYWRAGGQSLDEADLPWALEVADLGAAVHKPVRTYSHGMKQRLAIAQALLGRPELLVLDEPTDGLDPEQIRGMRELLARLGDEGHTVLVSSHLLAEVEQMCTHAAVVQRGRLLASGSMRELVGTDRTVVVETDDRDRAREVLHGHLGVEAVRTSGAGLAVSLGEHEPADVVAWLVAAQLRIQALTPRGKLEDAFLSLTGDTDPNGPAASPSPVGGSR